MKKEIPNKWAYTSLEELAQFVIGGDWGEDPEKSLKNDFVDVLCIRGSELKDWSKNKGKTAAKRKVKKSSLEKRKLLFGDILVEISGGGPDQPVGRTVIIDKEVLEFSNGKPKVCTNFFRLVRLHNDIEKAFVNYFFQYFYKTGEIVNYQGGTNNLRNLRFPEFSKIKFPLAPLPEQARIVAKLDALFTHLDTLKTKLDRIPELLKNFRQQVLTQAVTGKLTEEWRKGKELQSFEEFAKPIFRKRLNDFEFNIKAKNKFTRPEYIEYSFNDTLESNIKTWRICPVGLLCNSIVPGRDKPKSFTGEIPWITMPELIRDNITNKDASLFLTQKEIDEVKAKVIPENSVIVSIVGRFGIASIVQTKCVINQQLHAFLPSELVLPEYLLYYFKTQEEYMNSISSATTVAYINKTKANSIPINTPPIEEQQEIVRRIKQLFKIADTIEARYKTLKEKIDTLPQAILTKAFKGELVQQDPNDEPASVLLERIRREKNN